MIQLAAAVLVGGRGTGAGLELPGLDGLTAGCPLALGPGAVPAPPRQPGWGDAGTFRWPPRPRRARSLRPRPGPPCGSAVSAVASTCRRPARFVWPQPADRTRRWSFYGAGRRWPGGGPVGGTRWRRRGSVRRGSCRFRQRYWRHRSGGLRRRCLLQRWYQLHRRGRLRRRRHLHPRYWQRLRRQLGRRRRCRVRGTRPVGLHDTQRLGDAQRLVRTRWLGPAVGLRRLVDLRLRLRRDARRAERLAGTAARLARIPVRQRPRLRLGPGRAWRLGGAAIAGRSGVGHARDRLGIRAVRTDVILLPVLGVDRGLDPSERGIGQDPFVRLAAGTLTSRTRLAPRQRRTGSTVSHWTPSTNARVQAGGTSRCAEYFRTDT